MSRQPLTPDFITHQWQPIESATLEDGFIRVTWLDGLSFDAYSLWLAENAEGYGLEPLSRESMLEPRMLPDPGSLNQCGVGAAGELEITWQDGRQNTIHPGWLRYAAEGRLAPGNSLPDLQAWNTDDFTEPPTVSYRNFNNTTFKHWLALLIKYGAARLIETPAQDDFLETFATRVGCIRSSNFGYVFSVESKPEPDSTANTMLSLGQHTDLPSRETPPGFQFLHCVINDSSGGESLLSDGFSLVNALRKEQPEAFVSLTTDEWVFMNRAQDADHRWVGPCIELPSANRPLTLRAFYPVRSMPHMPNERIASAYAALKIFYEYTRDSRFTIRYRLNPGDLIVFDNRRILHGRDEIIPDGERRLRGCYMDQDEVYSRYRVLDR